MIETALREMFPDCSLEVVDDHYEIEAPCYTYSFPTITLAQLDSLATLAGTRSISVTARDDSRHYESCTITKYVLVLRFEEQS